MGNQESSVSISKALIYGAVIVALVIGGSFIFQRRYVEKNLPTLVQKAIQDLTPNPKNTAPVTKDDHILGDIKAPIKLVVYTDLECPFCKVFHTSVTGLKDNYIKDGKIAVVYRNLPLDQLHTKARPEAEATECAAKLGGNEAYWAYVDKIFAETKSNDGLDLNSLVKFAEELKLDKTAFANCQKDKATAEKVVAQGEEAAKAGAQGTPYPIVIFKDEVKGALQGAVPTEQLKQMVDDLLKAEG